MGNEKLERTLLIIKPDAVRRNFIGSILSAIEEFGFRIIALQMLRLDLDKAAAFYDVHRGKGFFENLIDYMSSGECVVAVLEAEKAITRLREICGATDPSKADPGTIRRRFGINVTMNSVHASDSIESARKEIAFFFPDLVS